MPCSCSIIPVSVFERFARDRRFSRAEQQRFGAALEHEREWRAARHAQIRLMTLAAPAFAPARKAARGAIKAPHVAVYDCRHHTALPGVLVKYPGDASAKRAADGAAGVAAFYKAAFGRDSIDGHGLAIVSSVHYSSKYDNAEWNGTQMLYGDGDGTLFVDFTKSDDVIGHELTHGVTQYSAQLDYENEAGCLNESMSDVFGSMYRQWSAGQTAAQADWLIGKEIVGPKAKAKGYTCLRDMQNPAAKHCIAPQPTKYSQYSNGMDPHDSSGIPNLAFCKAATAIGGKSWTVAGKVWYSALTGYPPAPKLKMKAFATRTRTEAKKLFPSKPAVAAAVDAAWKAVGL